MGSPWALCRSLLGSTTHNKTWFPDCLRSGVRSVVPLVVIIVVLFLRGKKLPIRGALEEKRLPLSPKPVRLVPQHAHLGAMVVLVAAFAFQDSGPRSVFAFGLSTSMIAAIIMLSMVVVTGYIGQISLVQMSLRRRRRVRDGPDDGERLDEHEQPVPGRSDPACRGRSPGLIGVIAAPWWSG